MKTPALIDRILGKSYESLSHGPAQNSHKTSHVDLERLDKHVEEEVDSDHVGHPMEKPSEGHWFRAAGQPKRCSLFVLYSLSALVLTLLGFVLGRLHPETRDADRDGWKPLQPNNWSEDFAFVAREKGNIEPMEGIGPRSPPLTPKKALIAIPAGRKAKSRVDDFISRVGFEEFSWVIFHWDDADWSEFEWYKNVTAIRKIKQTKFWFVKRYLTPSVIQNYRYLVLWDDDFGLPDDFDLNGLLDTMSSYDIHFAQPALLSHWHWPLTQHVENEKIGRFTNFVEMMFPIISSVSWECAWQDIPFDGKFFWGVDTMWYTFCGHRGYCRLAIMDAFPVWHQDSGSLAHAGDPHRESDEYRKIWSTACNRTGWEAEGVRDSVRSFCDAYSGNTSGPTTSRSIEPADMGTDFCPVGNFNTTNSPVERESG